MTEAERLIKRAERDFSNTSLFLSILIVVVCSLLALAVGVAL